MTRCLIALMLFLSLCGAASGVQYRVCRPDGTTPFAHREIMVGTELAIVVYSDIGAYWSGAFSLTGENLDYGVLSARGFNGLDWEESCFEAAGTFAAVWEWDEQDLHGFQLYGDFDAVAGDWFIIDYTATEIGQCSINLYDHDVDFFNPVDSIDFTHVPTRDFNDDGVVDLMDYGRLALVWGQDACTADDWCGGADLDGDGTVGVWDLAMFIDYWLEQIR